MNVICAHCRARTFPDEKIKCCSAGNVVFPLPMDVPIPLSALILSAHVRQNIRSYNSVMAFASTGHTNKSLPDGTFVLGGRSYHRIGSLLPIVGSKHCFSQIWSLDSADATSRRLEIMPTLRQSVLQSLHQLFLQHNPLARMFKQASDAVSNIGDVDTQSVGFTWTDSDDLASFQIGAVVEYGGFTRQIVVSCRGHQLKLKAISDGHPFYHALSYPILFPTGFHGWHPHLEFNNRKISLTEYGRFMLMHRDSPTHVQRCERLALEFYCDTFAQVEARNIAFHRQAVQQAKYMRASARAIMDQVHADTRHIDGTPVVLPSSFPNSPRYYHNLYLDAVALPRRYGKPDLFVTMTANPAWREITESIPAGSHWTHHQDIVARVFYLKFKAMMNLIVKKKLFGEVLAYVYRIEWQARGMPHVHILIILKDKIFAPRHIDAVVWAEIPCPTQYPVLHTIVCKRMIHDPCDTRPDAPCRKKKDDGNCYRHFPKDFNSATTVVGTFFICILPVEGYHCSLGDGYPQYRRRGRYTAMRNGVRIDDRWVVPYNPHLLQLFDCHINVEVAAHKRCFKYVYKYCFKSPDYCSIAVDEIEAYLAGRLLTASEAVWRLLGLKLHKEFPSVERLDVHLPEQQNVVFDPTADVRDIFEAAERSSSTLLEWFALNKRDPSANRLLYTEIPEHYVWKGNTWFPRSESKKGSMSVARIYSVSVHNHELFALRTLLTCQRGCTDFKDVATVDGFIHNSFRAACAAFGFVENDAEFVAAFTEYLETTIASTKSIRYQFALMLCCIAVVNAPALFELFSEDLIGTDSRYVALQMIEYKMQCMNRSLAHADYQFQDVPIIDDSWNPDGDAVPCALNAPNLSPEQCLAMATIQEMVQNVDDGNNNLLAVIASAGTGKTFFINHAVALLLSQGIATLCVAASALAATLLPQGKTAHAGLKIPIKCDDHSYCSWDMETRRLLKSMTVLFWDEISMVSYQVAETVDRSLRNLMGNDRKFGGKVVVFCGDFRQLPPVVKPGDGQYHSLLNRDWFLSARKATFTHNFRLCDDADYEELLPKIGDGIVDEIPIPVSCIAHSLEEAITRVYGDDVTHESNADSVMLAYTLHQCSIINEAVLSRIPGDTLFSTSVDDCSECKNPDDYPSDYIASLHITGCPPSILPLKQRARYMIYRNFDPPSICNGILAELISATRYNCKLRLLSGPGKNTEVILPRITFHVRSDASGLPFNFTRRQFPITPAYCLSVHKSQGQSLRRVGFVADTDAFSHGQVFVAMSRVGSWAQFVFFSPRGEFFIKNKVSKRLMNLLQNMSSI
jgi:hypothetical protein